MQQILKYFPQLSDTQIKQLEMLQPLYTEWNSKINVISRKDIDSLYEHHVLHSLGIAKYTSFKPGSKILDIGTGGGFPGIPLAILFPECQFHLIDSIGKKIRVATEVATAVGLSNVRLSHKNAIEEKERYDFVVSRAVMNAPQLIKLIAKNVSQTQRNAIPNGLICLKGGDLNEELAEMKRWHELVNLSDYFTEPFFETKKVLFVPL